MSSCLSFTLVFGVDIRYAIGASLVSVIATSSGAAAAYVREGFSNISIVAFALQRDRTYIVITLTVLGVLFYSLFGGGL